MREVGRKERGSWLGGQDQEVNFGGLLEPRAILETDRVVLGHRGEKKVVQLDLGGWLPR